MSWASSSRRKRSERLLGRDPAKAVKTRSKTPGTISQCSRPAMARLPPRFDIASTVTAVTATTRTTAPQHSANVSRSGSIHTKLATASAAAHAASAPTTGGAGDIGSPHPGPKCAGTEQSKAEADPTHGQRRPARRSSDLREGVADQKLRCYGPGQPRARHDPCRSARLPLPDSHGSKCGNRHFILVSDVKALLSVGSLAERATATQVSSQMVATPVRMVAMRREIGRHCQCPVIRTEPEPALWADSVRFVLFRSRPRTTVPLWSSSYPCSCPYGPSLVGNPSNAARFAFPLPVVE